MNKKKTDMSKKLIGLRVKRKRESMGLSQVELAKKMKYSSGYISQVEAGNCSFKVDILDKFAHIFNVDVSYFYEPLEDDNLLEIVNANRVNENLVVEYGKERTTFSGRLKRMAKSMIDSIDDEKIGEVIAFLLKLTKEKDE